MDLTLGQVRVLCDGHAEIDAMAEMRQIAAVRLAVNGTKDDIDKYARELIRPVSGDDRSGDDLADALDMMGLKEVTE